MDEIFGGSGVGSAPPGTIMSTPLFPCQTPPSLSADQPRGMDDQEPGPSTRHKTRRPTAQKKGSRLSFLDTYESHAERRTTALESLVRPELARWRRLKERRRKRGFEKKMLTCMSQIVSQLKDISKQQQNIISFLEKSNK